MDNDLLQALYGQNDSGAGQDILKAIIAGNQTGTQLLDQLSSGPSLKPESLDPLVKVLQNRLSDLVTWNMIPKHTIYETVHQYNQLVSYGDNVGIFMQEGASPQSNDTSYRRKSALIRYSGIIGELTHQAMLVKNADGIDPYTREVESKVIWLLTEINKAISTSNNDTDSLAFNGVFKQHYDGVLEANGGSTLDDYANDSVVIDARGKALSDDLIEDATHAVVNDRFGRVSTILSNPQVFSNYVKRFHESKRIFVGQPGAVSGATMGQSVNTTQTQYGAVNLKHDIFFDRRGTKRSNSAVEGQNAPASPTIDGTTPIAVVTDTSTKFGDGAGSYFYGVVAKNSTGQSAFVSFNTTAQAVTATQAVDLKFTITDNSNPATGFIIYRTEADVTDRTSATFYPIMEVSIAERTAGYDGAAAGAVRDRNRTLPNTHSAFVFEPENQIWEYIQLSNASKVEFAITTLSKRFAIINYGTPLLYQPGKIARIINLGESLT